MTLPCGQESSGRLRQVWYSHGVMFVSPRPGNGVAFCRRQLSTLIGVATIAACDAGTVSGEQASRADAASDEARVAYASTLPGSSQEAGVQTLSTELTVEANGTDLTSLDASVGAETDASVTSTSFTSSSEAGAFVADSDAGDSVVTTGGRSLDHFRVECRHKP